MTSTPLRVLIADDHPMIAEGLSAILTHQGIHVVARVDRAEEVVPTLAQTPVDVLILDVRFGDHMSGMDVLRALQTQRPGTRVVMYSQFDQDEIIREAYRLGASGFVTKSSSPSVIAEAVHQVAEGKVHFLPEIAERLALLGVRGDDSPLKNLDERSREVFRLMALGHTNVEIAEQMGLSPKTISTTSQSIKDELGISRPAEITRLALRLGLIEA